MIRSVKRSFNASLFQIIVSDIRYFFRWEFYDILPGIFIIGMFLLPYVIVGLFE